METAATGDPNSSSEQLAEREGETARNVANWTLPDKKKASRGRGREGGGRHVGKKDQRQAPYSRISQGKVWGWGVLIEYGWSLGFRMHVQACEGSSCGLQSTEHVTGSSHTTVACNVSSICA